MRALVKKIALHTILPLVIGLLIYMVARPDSWLTTKLLPLRFSFTENKWHSSSDGWLYRVLALHGPDFCWTYSLTSALAFWNYFSGLKQHYFTALIFVLILAQEFVQMLMPAYFTFDTADIVAAVMAFALSLLLNRKYV